MGSGELATYEVEVDVVRNRDTRPWKERTHYVSVSVPYSDSWSRMDNEARNLAVWMCWHVRGNMVTAARIVSVEV
jgi:hypothetical protein